MSIQKGSNSKSKKSPGGGGGEEEGNEVLLGLPCGRQKSKMILDEVDIWRAFLEN